MIGIAFLESGSRWLGELGHERTLLCLSPKNPTKQNEHVDLENVRVLVCDWHIGYFPEESSVLVAKLGNPGWPPSF